MLAANWIRQRADEKRLRCKLGFFLHIPFPPWDIFRLFPWADEILQGMLGELSLIPTSLEIFKFQIKICKFNPEVIFNVN